MPRPQEKTQQLADIRRVAFTVSKKFQSFGQQQQEAYIEAVQRIMDSIYTKWSMPGLRQLRGIKRIFDELNTPEAGKFITNTIKELGTKIGEKPGPLHIGIQQVTEVLIEAYSLNRTIEDELRMRKIPECEEPRIPYMPSVERHSSPIGPPDQRHPVGGKRRRY